MSSEKMTEKDKEFMQFTYAQVLDDGIRRAVGDDVYILSCSSPIMATVGLADSVRSSVDIFERYSSLLASAFPLLGRPAKCVNFLQESIPSVLDFGRCGNFEILAFINWGEKEKKTFTLDRKGYVFEYWRKEFYGYSDGQMQIEVPAHQVKLFTISNGEGIVPLGVDDTILPQLQWKYQDGALKIELVKDDEGIYVYSDRDIQSNYNYEKVGDDVYLVKGGKCAERVIIK